MFGRLRRPSLEPSLSTSELEYYETSESIDSALSYRSRRASHLSNLGSLFRRRSRDSTISSANTLVDRSDSTDRPVSSRLKSVGDALQVPNTSFRSSSHTRKLSLSPPESSTEDMDHRRINPLGLHAVYEPETIPSVDIIFVHGLGGTSQATWAWNRDTNFFWPGKWLPKEPGICTARILSFGYDADFKSTQAGVVSSVSDFAKDLLFSMKFGRNEESGTLGIGEVVSSNRPVVFVAHSMGGLVVKKAYLLGHNDAHYKDLVSSVKAIIFLATPHRGSTLAETLNRVLSISLLTSSKQYISDLQRSSASLEDLNEQFRNIVSDLQLFSFYETILTPIGPISKLIVEKDSSILGYTGEISKPLYANHHEVCKFASTSDENYLSVRNTLNAVVSQYQNRGEATSKGANEEEMCDIQAFLGVTTQQLPSDDQDFFYKRWAPGTCDWILSQPDFVDWFRDDSATSSILWLTAGPANGKSTLASFIVNWLLDQQCLCQYYYFRFSDQSKRSLGTMLRALAVQIYRDISPFRTRLKELSNFSSKLEVTDTRTLWQKLFVSILYTIPINKPMFWVIDGLDECESSRALLDCFSSLPLSMAGIRIIITSRFTSALSTKFSHLAATTPMKRIALDNNSKDFAIYAHKELDPMPWPTALRQQVVDQVLERAQGSFLWVYFALKEVVKCHTPGAIQEVLNDIPTGMENLYHSIEADMLKSIRQADLPLAKSILRWATCSRFPLTLSQLEEALLPEFSELLDSRHTVTSLCGQFVVIDSQDRVTMLHQTARDYLLRSSGSNLGLGASDSQIYLLGRCLSALMQSNGPSVIGAQHDSAGSDTDIKFRTYALSSWSHHLKASPAASDAVFDGIVQFFSNQSVLDWINALASSKQIKSMVHTSKAVTHFVQKRRRIDAAKMPLLHRLKDLDWLETWATDLIRIVGKFGSILMEEPASIYRLIPPFCPQDSAIYRVAGIDSSSLGLSVTGLSNMSWDDRLAKLLVGQDAQALKIRCATKLFAVATSKLTIILWDAQSLEVARTLKHNEHITAMSFSEKEDLFASYGFLTTVLWNTATGQRLFTIDNPVGARALVMRFYQVDAALIIGCNDRRIRRLSLTKLEEGWQTLNFHDSRDELVVHGSYQNSPCCMEFSIDTSMVAIGYRGAPLSVWQLEPARMVSQCLKNGYNQKTSKAWMNVDRVQWHPTTGEVLGIYGDGSVFKWHPFRNEHQQIHTVASEFHCSPEGTMLVTSDSQGNVKLYDYSSFSLVYQLSCDNPITALCIGPDCQRIYDLRGSTCNIWEPNAMVRLSDSELSGSDTNSEYDGSVITKGPSEAWAEQVEMITALTLEPGSSMLAIGDEAGQVNRVDPDTKHCVELWTSGSFMTIENLTYSNSGRYLASSDLGGKVIVHKMGSDADIPSRGKKPAQHKVLDKGYGEFTGSIDQLLFDSGESRLLISGRNGTRMWSIDTASDTSLHLPPDIRVACKYITNPLDETQLLAFDFGGVSIYKWDDLSLIRRLQFEDISITLTESHNNQAQDADVTQKQAQGELLKIILSRDRKYIVLAFSRPMEWAPHATHSGLRPKYIRVIRTSSFEPRDSKTNSFENEVALTQVSIPEYVAARMEMPLAVLDRDRLVFIDNKYWICTWQMNSNLQPEAALRKHFFLPRDWIGTEELKLCTLNAEGNLLYPRHGQIAVVQSNLAIMS